MVHTSKELDLSLAHLEIPFRPKESSQRDLHVQSDRHKVEDYHEAGERFFKY